MADIIIAPLIVIIGLILYFIPSVISSRKNHRNFVSILLLNIFLGWTLIGWVGALIWALKSDSSVDNNIEDLSIMSETTPNYESKTNENDKSRGEVKRPSWATKIGVLAIIFGVLGIIGSAQEIGMPKLIETQEAMMKELSKEQSSVPANDQTTPIFNKNMLEAMQKNFNVPEWYKTWASPMGIVSIIIAAFYFYSGIALLIVKPYAIKLFYYVLSVSIGWALIQILIFSASGSPILMAQSSSSIASMVIDVVIGFVVYSGAKEVYLSGKVAV
jgi:hypothetical protein